MYRPEQLPVYGPVLAVYHVLMWSESNRTSSRQTALWCCVLVALCNACLWGSPLGCNICKAGGKNTKTVWNVFVLDEYNEKLSSGDFVSATKHETGSTARLAVRRCHPLGL